MGEKAPSVMFPLVGIGASAGGLEALEVFLKNVPVDSGIAYVVVQHLDPTRTGMMPELLQRITPMKVVQASNNLRMEPDHVYVIPPNRDLTTSAGALYLSPQVEHRGLRLPVDAFMISLAKDRGSRAIGVILSGMGSDGTAGLRAIREKSGLILAQDPSTAGFPGMPESVIAAGLADSVAPPSQLPALIIDRVGNHEADPEEGVSTLRTSNRTTLNQIVGLLHSNLGQDFSQYKESNLLRRLERRMLVYKSGSLEGYLRIAQQSPHEVEILFRELLIGVTNFFRDPDVWDFLKDEVISQLLDKVEPDESFRAWVPGCSSGEEAYSLAMLLAEAQDGVPLLRHRQIQIFATDLDRWAIERARLGTFPAQIADEMSAERLHRFFIPNGDGYRVVPEIRAMVIFAPQNLIMDPPFTKLDFLSCRNLLIYLTRDLQRKLIPLFQYSLKPDGMLLLGSAESIGDYAKDLVPVSEKMKVYRRSRTLASRPFVEFPLSFTSPKPARLQEGPMEMQLFDLEKFARQLVVERFSPPAVLVNGDGDIVYISARTGKYLEPSVGKTNMNIFAMAREGLGGELASAMKRALEGDVEVVSSGVTVKSNGDSNVVDLLVQPLRGPEAVKGLVAIVFFENMGPSLKKPKSLRIAATGSVKENRLRVGELELEVQHLQAQLRHAREDRQSSHEELKSANEELQSTNEELQSTNEELTTSKEELQSLNEELQTVNAELQSKVEELSRANDDMINLLDSTEIATVFLDVDLNVRRYTEMATRIIKLIPGDVGRPLSDLSTNLEYGKLTADAKEVLRTLVFCEKRVVAKSGKSYVVRIMPYRTMVNLIDGLVITFVDVTEGTRLPADEGSAQKSSTKPGKGSKG